MGKGEEFAAVVGGDTWTCKDELERPWIKGRSLQSKGSRKYLCESGPLFPTQHPSASRSSWETTGIFLHWWLTESQNLLLLPLVATRLPRNVVTGISDVDPTLSVLPQSSQGKAAMTGISLPTPVLLSEDHLFCSSPTRVAKERWATLELKLLHSLIALITAPAAGLLADFGRDHFCHRCLLSRSTLHGPTCCKSWSTYTEQISRVLLHAEEQCWIKEKK